MIDNIKDFIKQEKLIEKDETIVVGVSGGIDSMVLLNVLYNLGYKIVIAHVNHNVRVESDNELIFVRDYAKEKNIPFESIKLDKIEGTNFQDEARRLRYEFFFDVAKKYMASKIATAHHLDDLLETILMRMSRGSNLYGYGGIRPLINYGNVSIIRPLLCVTRSEIKNYQEANNIPFMEDGSNSKDKYTRNRYRHNIVPILVEENPNIYQNVLRYSKQMYQAFDFIRKQSIKLYNKNRGEINNDEFASLDDAVKLDFISYILEQNQIPCSYNKINLIKKMILTGKAHDTVHISKGLCFMKNYETSSITRINEYENYEFVLNLEEQAELPDGSIVKITRNIKNNEEIFLKLCYNTLVLPLKIRNRRDGDYFKFVFGKKKIKDLFIDMKIPMDVRKKVPIVLNMDDEILGIPGIIKGPKDVIDPIYVVYEVKKNDD
ncbi:MAG: tRNA lysidine(34) synthetase TilS [Acholeplasmatales bacterium]|nr:tRNA lysidine(34) synthetase TilS [Acholeplasmatales bacterium]